MVCIECFVVPVLFVIAAYFKQFVSFFYSRFVQSSTSPAPAPFNPSMINLAAHGLSAGKVDSTKLSAGVDEEKEGPASRPRTEDDYGEAAGSEALKRRK